MLKPMKIKKTKMICAVKGCGERATVFISRGGDFAGTPNICENCLKEAFKLLCAESNEAVVPLEEDDDIEQKAESNEAVVLKKSTKKTVKKDA